MQDRIQRLEEHFETDSEDQHLINELSSVQELEEEEKAEQEDIMDEDEKMPLLSQQQKLSTNDTSLSNMSQRQRSQFRQDPEDLSLKQLVNTNPSQGVVPYRDTNMRWVMLIFGCVFLMGNYFCYDEPAALSFAFQAPVENSGAGLTAIQYSQLYTIYSLPNIFLPLCGGVFLDRLGIRAGLLLFTMILTFGQLVFALGGSYNSFNMMLAGRFIFGSGAECMSVAASAIISSWFQGKELSFALGVNLSIARLGSFLNGITQPAYEQSFGLGSALMLGFEICVFSLLAALALVCLDAHADRVDEQNREILNQQQLLNGGQQQQIQESDEKEEDSDNFQCSDITSFSLPLWLISASCVFVYMSVFPYIQTIEPILIEKFSLPVTTAGTLYGLPYLISAAICPVFGYAIDRIGKRTQFILSSSLMTVLACLLTIMLPGSNEPDYTCLVPLVLLGIGYSVYASALWGSIPSIVEKRTLGTAFGLCTALQNLGLVIAPMLVSWFANPNASQGHQYDQSLWLLTLFSFLGTVVNLWLLYDDRYNRDSVLERVAAPEQQQQQQQQSELTQDN